MSAYDDSVNKIERLLFISGIKYERTKFFDIFDVGYTLKVKLYQYSDLKKIIRIMNMIESNFFYWNETLYKWFFYKINGELNYVQNNNEK